MTWYCYLIKNGNLTYNGSTNNPKRRLRQHNGEIKGGAKYTSKIKGGWEIYCLMSGFPDKINTLQCEWRWKHCNGMPGKRESKYCGVNGRIKGLNEVLCSEKWTSRSQYENKNLKFKLYIVKEFYKELILENINENIEIIILDKINPEDYN
jgi:predicted GIY-YIG superfamily endonuclease